MLENILNGSENPDIILVEDHGLARGELLLKSVICSLSSRIEKVHVFLFEYLPRKLLEGLPQSVTQRLTIHDLASDPLGWEKSGDITMDTEFCDYICHLSDPHDTVAIVMDCLSNLILHRSPAYTCQVLHRVNRHIHTDGQNSQMVAMIHKGLHDNTVMGMLHHTVTSVLDLGPPQSIGYHGTCNLMLKKTSGKVLRQNLQYKLNSLYEMIDVQEVRLALDNRSNTEAVLDPAANLTFNLSLSDREKEARSNLVLPYLHKKEKLKVPSSSGSAKIFYQPDEADDFDEEDPDDDLDI